MTSIGQAESQQIKICRVLCIFFMMSVHVNPGFGQATVISSGELKIVGDFWAGFLGRASVATLSFISGYLLIKTALSKPWNALAIDRFKVLVVPMLAWNIIFIILQFCEIIFISGLDEGSMNSSYVNAVAYFTGLNGSTANQSLFFLRDIFVSLILVRMAFSVISKRPTTVIVVVLAIAIFDLLEPLVYRPSILFFVTLGAIYSIKGYSISNIIHHKWLLVMSSAGLVTFYYTLSFFDQETIAVKEVQNLLKRGFLIIFILTVSSVISKTAIGEWIARLENHIYITYLMHGSLFGILWVLWASTVGDAQALSYLIFFFMLPIVAVFLGQLIGLYVDILPSWLQKLLRGKAKSPRSNIPTRA